MVGVPKMIDWIFKRKQQAITRFWSVPEGMLDSLTGSSASSSTQEEPAPPLPERPKDNGAPPVSSPKTHVQRVHDLEMQPSLQYESLSHEKGEIRLLQLVAASNRDEPIQCALKHVSLDSMEFTALSYCWGDTSHQQTISVRGQVVNVTQNLFDALRELRHAGVEYVWVDALCNNQSDVIEMRQQIPRMTSIYSRAKYVFAWLGLEEYHFAELARTCADLKAFNKTVELQAKGLANGLILNDLLRMWLHELDISENKRIAAGMGEMGFPKALGALKRFATGLSKEDQLLHAKKLTLVEHIHYVVGQVYWRRAWILQEMTVAGDIILACGAHRLDFDILSRIIEELEELHQDGIFDPFTPYHRHIFNVANLRAKWRPREPIHMLIALRESRHTSATKVHDRVYSLMGVCFDSSRFVTEVNYQYSIGTVIRQMTTHSIQATKTLDIICMQSQSRDKESKLPSWAPNWLVIGDSKFEDRMINYLVGADDHERDKSKHKYWSATSKSSCSAVFIDEGSVLQVRGKSIGVITKCSGVLEEDSIPEAVNMDDQKSPRRTFKDVLHRVKARRATDDLFDTLTVYKAKVRVDDGTHDFGPLWASAALNRLQKEEPSAHKWLVDHEQFVIHGKPLVRWSKGNINWIDFDERAFVKATRFFYHVAADKDILFNTRKTDLVTAVVRALKDGLRLMEISNGMSGWAHPAAQQADEIYLLQGCSMPVILRPIKSETAQRPAYTVVGDAYVQGIMYGEAWDHDETLEDVYLA